MDNTRNQDRIGEKELLVVSFGTVSDESRRLSIGSVEEAIEKAAGDEYSVRRCFTSQMIINIINKREGVRIDNVAEALDRAVSNGVRTLVVQPTHIMKGIEYEKLRRIVSEYADSFDQLAIGAPLLASDDDFCRVAEALAASSEGIADDETALVFMGHGTDAESNTVYRRMQAVMDDKGMSNCYVGTVEASPTIDDVLEAVGRGSYSRIILRPMMLVAGNHAVNDMASQEDPDSWYSRFTAAGYETRCIIEGMGQISEIRTLYAEHALSAILSLK